MIYWITTRRHGYPIRKFLASLEKQLAGHVLPISYEKLFRSKQRGKYSPSRGTYVFSDLERLSSSDTIRAADVVQQLKKIGCRVVNCPARCLRRYDLLRGLHDRGENNFNVFRLTSGERPERFPVFLRRENDHSGSRTALLSSESEFDKAVADLTKSRLFYRDELGKRRLVRRGAKHANQLLVTEFCDTADDNGIYRKYSAFCIGGHIVPRHLFFGHAWMLKGPEISQAWSLAEERDYVFGNPHEQRLQEIFRFANIEYGRIDYAMMDGRVQVWEINTNPMVMVPADFEKPERQPVQQHFAAQFSKAVLELEGTRVTHTVDQETTCPLAA